MDIEKYLKRLGLDRFEEAADLGGKTRRRKGVKGGAGEVVSASSSGMLRAMLGSLGYIGDDHIPAELIGGICPRVVGEEEEIVWNAAAEACDTERVHVVWNADGNRVWYLAVRSSDLASQPNTWCPLAAFLPGMPDAQPAPVCYTYFGEELAVLMAVNSDGLQVFRGTGPVVRAKAERLSREMAQAQIVNIDPDRIEHLTPVPWYSMSLFEDRARRALATVSVVSALAVIVLSLFVWMLSSVDSLSSSINLSEANKRTQTNVAELLRQAENSRLSPMRDQISRFLSVNDGLIALNGYLYVYEIKEGKTRWRAIVPPSATAERITSLGGKNIETVESGVAIGNQAQLDYEKETGKK